MQDSAQLVTRNAFHGWKPSQNDGSKVVVDKDTGLFCLHVRTLSSLIQAIGYKKFVANKKNGQKIYFRGQTELYKTSNLTEQYIFQPTALRGIRNEDAVQNAWDEVKNLVSTLRKMNNGLLGDEANYSDGVIEGLLQQYGLKTTWIDVVDNIWVALWFSCYKSSFPVEVDAGTGKNCRRAFIKMDRRDPNRESAESRFAYILLLGDGENAEVVDLRCALPSMFIRPHIQHGLLIRTKDRKSANMASLIQGIIRIDLYDALEWLGEGRILTSESMMPPPNMDSGFKQLLSSEVENDGEPFVRFPIYC